MQYTLGMHLQVYMCGAAEEARAHSWSGKQGVLACRYNQIYLCPAMNTIHEPLPGKGKLRQKKPELHKQSSF